MAGMRQWLWHNVLAVAAGLLIIGGLALLLTRDEQTAVAWLLIGLGVGAAVGAVATRRR
jgi:hypothetical protein